MRAVAEPLLAQIAWCGWRMHAAAGMAGALRQSWRMHAEVWHVGCPKPGLVSSKVCAGFAPPRIDPLAGASWVPCTLLPLLLPVPIIVVTFKYPPRCSCWSYPARPPALVYAALHPGRRPWPHNNASRRSSPTLCPVLLCVIGPQRPERRLQRPFGSYQWGHAGQRSWLQPHHSCCGILCLWVPGTTVFYFG